jgi:hypothetical protein
MRCGGGRRRAGGRGQPAGGGGGWAPKGRHPQRPPRRLPCRRSRGGLERCTSGVRRADGRLAGARAVLRRFWLPYPRPRAPRTPGPRAGSSCCAGEAVPCTGSSVWALGGGAARFQSPSHDGRVRCTGSRPFLFYGIHKKTQFPRRHRNGLGELTSSPVPLSRPHLRRASVMPFPPRRRSRARIQTGRAGGDLGP